MQIAEVRIPKIDDRDKRTVDLILNNMSWFDDIRQNFDGRRVHVNRAAVYNAWGFKEWSFIKLKGDGRNAEFMVPSEWIKPINVCPNCSGELKLWQK